VDGKTCHNKFHAVDGVTFIFTESSQLKIRLKEKFSDVLSEFAEGEKQQPEMFQQKQTE
jgi:hypothetical protein